MNSIENINFNGQNVLVRVDFNVPLNSDYEITDYSRIVETIPTIKKVVESGGRAILISHLGRPKGKINPNLSLIKLIPYLEKHLNYKITFINNCIGEEVKNSIKNLKNKEILLLENLRFYKEESNGDISFSKKLAELAEIYINDAFGTSHRKHSSTFYVAKFFKDNRYIGLLIKKEIERLNKILITGKKPITVILGGSKISTKIDVIDNLIKKVDNIIIGGGMAYTFSKALGGEIGNSMIEKTKINLAKNLIDKAKKFKCNLSLPVDSINGISFTNDSETYSSSISSIKKNFIGMDIGVKTRLKYDKIILNSKTILWNGPMGVFEFDKFSKGTEFIIKSVLKATKKGAYSLIGGGDSIAAVKKYNFKTNLLNISTGGGAMLKFLEGSKLDVIDEILSD